MTRIDKTSTPLEYIRHIPQWFVGITGLIYLTGFLIVTTHLSRFGIRESGSELFRLKFIQVGLLFVLPYLVFTGPLLTILIIRSQSTKLVEHAPISNLILPNNFQTVLYYKKTNRLKNVQSAISAASIISFLEAMTLIVYFGPHYFVKKHFVILLLLIIFTVFGLFLSTSVAEKHFNTAKCANIPSTMLARLLLLVFVLVCCFLYYLHKRFVIYYFI